MDVFSKSDPCCKVTQIITDHISHRQNEYSVGKTETVKNNLNPVFVKIIPMDYLFEKE
jgi:hypothetical protein